ncbi:MAG: 2'-5' RNA ligase family protein [Burkholderiales bacterium]|nr:2'-5' RNA ligase family protein [Burkholderiales bacterium]
MAKVVDDGLYHIALIPPSTIRDEVVNFQILAEKKFGGKLTARSPAHITIIPPFRANSDALNSITRKLGNALKKNHQPIDTMITGFYHLNNRTIIMEINKSRHLEILFTDIKQITHNITFSSNNNFVPHITIAKRDLGPEVFTKAYDYFGHIPFSRNFIANEIGIFSYESGQWTVTKTFSIG